jgi:hypothetical protein
MITTKLLIWVCGGLLAALLVTGGFAGCEHHDANAARAERDAANDGRDTAVDANKSNLSTIDAQNKALNEWMKLGESPAAVARLVAQAMTSAKALATEANAVLAAKEKERANPECAAVLSASLERACPAVARGLRQYASRHEDDPGRDPGAGREASPDGAHGGLRAALPVPGS